MDSGMFYGIQQGSIAALQADSDWFEGLNAIYQKRRNKVEALATTLGTTFDPESVGMFVWAKLPEEENDAEAYIDRILYEKDVFITPGSIFGSQGARYIRFSLCVSEEKIQEALNRFQS